MDNLGIGRLIDGTQDRDAIHVAVAPVTAYAPICPANRIRFATDDNTDLVVECRGINEKAIGIADPFLDPFKVIPDGRRFWMFLFPGTITSLRHDWTHPAFAAAAKPLRNDVRDLSIAWIANWAEPYGVTYRDMIAAAKNWLEHDEWFNRGGTFEGEHVPYEFWIHFQRATGITVDPEDCGNLFTCSC